MHKTVLVAGPNVEPISIEEAEDHLKISGDADYTARLLATARKQVERYLNRALITQTWKVYYDRWHYEMKIPFPKLQSVTSVNYYNIEGVLTTLSTDSYWAVTTDEPGRIVRKYDAVYPELQYGRPDAIEIAFTAGFGNAASAIPDEIKHAIKVIMTNLYENRSDIVIGKEVPTKIPGFITDLIHSYKIYNF